MTPGIYVKDHIVPTHTHTHTTNLVLYTATEVVGKGQIPLCYPASEPGRELVR